MLRALVLATLLSGCALNRLTRVSDSAAIRSARVAQNKALADHDAARAASFWTEDVTLRRGLGQAVVGRAEYQRLLEAPVTDSTLVYYREPVEIVLSEQWPLAFETGTWQGRLGGATGRAVIAGRYSAQWVKRGGQWLIRSEVFVALECDGVGCRSTAAP